jgi:endoglucanase
VKQQSLDFLERLLSTISPSGFEEEAARVWIEEAKPFTDRVYGDLHGSAFAVVNQGGSPKVMLAGHIDEIGLMITHIDDEGYLYFTGIGGWDPQILQGQRGWIKTKAGRVTGVIGKKPIHLLKEEDRSKALKLEELWIDIGAKDKAEASAAVAIGDPVVLAYGFETLRNDFAISRGFDDKCGAFVVLEAARLLAELNPKAEIYAVATSQEEIGLRGAQTSAYGIDPKVGIAVDVGFASDFPTMGDLKKQVGDVTVGKGPIIARGANINPKIFNLLIETALEQEILHQIVPAPRGTGTDANAMQLTRAGVATGLISIPNRYMHSPCELVSLNDLENAARLIAHAVEQITDKMNFVPSA